MKDQIINLRLQGYSLQEITEIVGCAKSTASYHCKNVIISDKAQKRILKRSNESGARGRATQLAKVHKRREEIVKKAIEEWIEIKQDPKMLIYLALYWAEGDKGKSRSLRLANSDPDIIKIGYEFLCNNTDSPIVAEIRYYPGQNQNELKTYWSELLPVADIRLIDVADRDKRIRKVIHKNKHGMCYLNCCDADLWLRVMTLIKQMKTRV